MKDSLIHNRACWDMHVGEYAIEGRYLRRTLELIRSGTLQPRTAVAMEGGGREQTPKGAISEESRKKGLLDIGDGLAMIAIDGPTMKGDSKFGDTTNSVRVRQQARQAAADGSVGGVLLRIDSPGGTVAGLEDMVEDLQKLSEKKPVIAFGEDLVASAAYWAATAAPHIMATPSTQVGSIGTLLVLWDQTQQYKMEGIEVLEFSTGPFKGTGIPGRPISDEQKAYLQSRVNQFGKRFKDAVGVARGLGGERLSAVIDGRVWLAGEAQTLGLIDAIGGIDDAVNELRRRVDAKRSQTESAGRRNRSKLAAASLAGL